MFKGWHDQQVTVLPTLAAAMAFLTVICVGGVFHVAAAQGIPSAPVGFIQSLGEPQKDQYFDYAYAEHVWDDLSTVDTFVREYNRHKPVFGPWTSLYRTNRSKAMKEMNAAKPGSDLRRGYDIQLAYDGWLNFFYARWWRTYATGYTKLTFEQWQAKRNEKREGVDLNSPTCKARKILQFCRPIPDWRDADDKKREKAMMDMADKKWPSARP